ncbi:MAG TPA: hypothetical protein VFO55_09205 [Gemmatimonadaceae bacterium]|nr:hypothetical protein [Gemmatimonadaceae bacterium]
MKIRSIAMFLIAAESLLLARQQVPAAELFGAGVFSTGAYELPPSFDLDGRRAWFTVSTPQYGRKRWIMESRLTPSGWSAPTVAAFSGDFDDADPYVSPDGSKLFFLSKRPVTPGGAPKRDFDIWVMDRAGDQWGSPRHLGALANGNSDEHYVTSTRGGSLVIAAVRPDSRNLGDLYEVPFEGGTYGEPRNLGPAVNAPETHETTPWVSPDGSYIIFASRGRQDTQGDMDLYVTRRDSSGAWGRPVNLGPTVNSRAADYCPLVSPDGKYLYFSSTRGFLEAPPARPTARQLLDQLSSPGNGLGDTWRVPMSEVRRIAGIPG